MEQAGRSITLAVLAGGEGRRMGGAKGDLILEGRPILERLVDRLRWEGPTLLVTAPGRERPAGAMRFGREMVDPAAGEGPLRGVLTALEAAETEIVVVIPLDMPELRREQLLWMAGQLEGRAEADVVLIERVDAGGGRQLEPLPAALRREGAAQEVRRLLGENRRALRSIVAGRAAVVPCPDDWPLETWTNINRPEELQAYDWRKQR